MERIRWDDESVPLGDRILWLVRHRTELVELVFELLAKEDRGDGKPRGRAKPGQSGKARRGSGLKKSVGVREVAKVLDRSERWVRELVGWAAAAAERRAEEQEADGD